MAETGSRHRRQLPYIKRQQLIWLAGLVEGEGCFYNKHGQGVPYFGLSMTDEDVIAYVANLFDCNYYSRNRKDANTKTVHSINICGYKTLDLIDILLPYMFSRRKEKMIEVKKAWTKKGPPKNGTKRNVSVQ